MSKLLLILFGGCLLISCSTTGNVMSPVLTGKNSNVVLETDHLKKEPSKLSTENKAISILNQLFNTDVSNTSMVLIIKNDSDCDFTMQIMGKNNYSVPVGAKKTESIILEKGDYEMRSNVCEGYYRALKSFSENTEVSIKYTLVKNTQ